MTWRVRLTSPALRDLDRLPPRASEPLVAFIFGSLPDNPKRRGKPLRNELHGSWAARRGDYRVVYRLAEHDHMIVVTAVASARVYRARTSIGRAERDLA